MDPRVGCGDRRAGEADRDHAPAGRRRKALDLRGRLLPRAELLHRAAGAGDATACHLCRMAGQPHDRRHRCRRPVHPAGRDLHDGALLRLCPRRRVAGRAGDIRRRQAGDPGDHGRGYRALRPPRAARSTHARGCGAGVPCGVLQASPSPDHFRAGLAGHRRRNGAAARLHAHRRPPRRTAPPARTSAKDWPIMRGPASRSWHARSPYGWRSGLRRR